MAKETNMSVERIMEALSSTNELFARGANDIVESTEDVAEMTKTFVKALRDSKKANDEMIKELKKVSEQMTEAVRGSKEKPGEVNEWNYAQVKYMLKKTASGQQVSDEKVSKADNTLLNKLDYQSDRRNDRIVKGIGSYVNKISSFFSGRNFWGRFVSGIMEGTRHLLKKTLMDLLLAGIYRSLMFIKEKWGTTGVRIALGITALVSSVALLVPLVKGIVGFVRILTHLPRIFGILAGSKGLGDLFKRFTRVRGWSEGRGVLGKGASAIERYGARGIPGALGTKGSRTLSSFGMDVIDDFAKTGKGVAQKEAVKIAEKEAIKVTEKGVAKGVGKSLLKKIPGIGLGAGLLFGAQRAMEGDWLGATGEVASGVASTLPGAGTAVSAAIDAALIAKDIKSASKGPEGPKRVNKTGEAIIKEIKDSSAKSTKFMENFSKWGKFIAILGTIGTMVAGILSWLPGFKGKEKVSSTPGSGVELSESSAELGKKALQNVKFGQKGVKYGTINGVSAVDMRTLGLHGKVAGENSLPYVRADKEGELRWLDELLHSWGYTVDYTSAMGGEHQGGLDGRSHAGGNKIDFTLRNKRGEYTTLTSEQEAFLQYVGGTRLGTGAVGKEAPGQYGNTSSHYLYDYSLTATDLSKLKNASEIPSGVSIVPAPDATSTVEEESATVVAEKPVVSKPTSLGSKSKVVSPETPSTGEAIDLQVANMSSLFNLEKVFISEYLYGG